MINIQNSHKNQKNTKAKYRKSEVILYKQVKMVIGLKRVLAGAKNIEPFTYR